MLIEEAMCLGRSRISYAQNPYPIFENSTLLFFENVLPTPPPTSLDSVNQIFSSRIESWAWWQRQKIVVLESSCRQPFQGAVPELVSSCKPWDASIGSPTAWLLHFPSKGEVPSYTLDNLLDVIKLARADLCCLLLKNPNWPRTLSWSLVGP